MSVYDDLKKDGGKACFDREAARIFEALGIADEKWAEEVGNAPRRIGEKPLHGGFRENNQQWSCGYRITRDSGKTPYVHMRVPKWSGVRIRAGSVEFMVIVAGVEEGGILAPDGDFDAFIRDVTRALDKLAP